MLKIIDKIKVNIFQIKIYNNKFSTTSISKKLFLRRNDEDLVIFFNKYLYFSITINNINNFLIN